MPHRGKPALAHRMPGAAGPHREAMTDPQHLPLLSARETDAVIEEGEAPFEVAADGSSRAPATTAGDAQALMAVLSCSAITQQSFPSADPAWTQPGYGMSQARTHRTPLVPMARLLNGRNAAPLQRREGIASKQLPCGAASPACAT